MKTKSVNGTSDPFLQDLHKSQIHVALFAPLPVAVQKELVDSAVTADFRAGNRILKSNDTLKGFVFKIS